jgi:diguanylate cyclase (GGDEF)-like protein/PAS domain S-box-containing protein
VVRPDGSERHIYARGRCETDLEGKVRRAYGTIHDVTEIRQMEETLRHERDFTAALLGAIRDGYTFSQDGVLQDVNDELLEMTGFSRAELLGARRPYPFWPAEEVDRLTAITVSIALTGGGEYDAALVRKDGTRFDALLSCRPARTRGGEILGLVTTIRDISSEKRRERALDQLANEDGLTGLLNRRAFDAALRREHLRAARSGRAASIAIIDIDFFKSVNDRFGHPVGDAVLQEMAERLRTTVRGGDILGRVGGEEIGWIIADMDARQAVAVCERIRDRIASFPFARAGTLTVSIGFAQLSGGASPEAAYSLADGALYRAKRLGRNRVEAAHESNAAIGPTSALGPLSASGPKSVPVPNIRAAG